MFEKVLEWLKAEGLTKQSFEKNGSIYYPSDELVINLHDFLIKTFRGKEDEIHEGILNEGNITYALYHCQTQIAREGEREKQLLEKSAFLMSHYFTSHTFIDGNKRTGFVIALLFLSINKFHTSLSLINYMGHIKFFKKIANRRPQDKRNIPEILEWFEKNMKKN